MGRPWAASEHCDRQRWQQGPRQRLCVFRTGFAEAAYKQPNDFPRVGAPQTEIIGRRAYDFGFNVGGPLIQNKFFWYGASTPRSKDGPHGPVNYTRALGPRTPPAIIKLGRQLNFNITEATGWKPRHSAIPRGCPCRCTALWFGMMWTPPTRSTAPGTGP